MKKLTLLAALFISLITQLSAQQTFRLYNGITLYVVNPQGKPFDINLEIRDINTYANGPREILFKVYEPDGKPVVREIIPDDGVTQGAFLGQSGGWDHELMYRSNIYAKGTKPTVGFSSWSDPAKLQTLKARTIKKSITAGKKGIYRILLAGTQDNYVTISLSPDLKYGVAGHPSFFYGTGSMLKESFVYVPKGTDNLFFIFIEPDMPRSRVFTLKDPSGKTILKGSAPGAYFNPTGSYGKKNPEWQKTKALFADGSFDQKILSFSVTPGKSDFMVQLTFAQPRKGAFKDYVGMGSQAIFCPDKETAEAIKGGTTVVDGDIFWHPFQVRFAKWLKAHPMNQSANQKLIRKDLVQLYDYFRLLETSDGRGSASWKNWAYAFGYYGCKIWRLSWMLMKNPDVPNDVKAIIKEGLVMAGDRLAFAVAMERVNGNAFSQIPVELWYCKEATGDPIHKQLFETFWKRWSSGEGWGKGSGISRSGDSQEHFAHDCHYGSYLMDNWQGGTWLKHGIIPDAKGKDDRFEKILDRYQELYSYLYCPKIPANPWSSRTHMWPHKSDGNWKDKHPWKGAPGPDFTVSVNGGNEWFAARRKNYYFLSFHGRLAPEWMCRSFSGQLGFGGGTICQLTVPGKGTVLAGTLKGSYGEGMHPSNWRNFHIHSIVGELWNGQPLIASISDHEDTAKLVGNTVTSTGEVRNGNVKITRSYTFLPDRIKCSVALGESDYKNSLAIWSHDKKWGDVKLAYEMIPFIDKARGKNAKVTQVTLFKGEESIGQLTETPVPASKIKIDRGGYGVDIILPKAMPVALGKNSTVMIQLTNQEVKPERIKLDYELVPYGN